MQEVEAIRSRFDLLSPYLDEKTRRLLVAAEAQSIGFGGISIVARATGVTRDTIRRGIDELQGSAGSQTDRIRRSGGGRKRTVDTDPTLQADLEKLISPTERGDPESPLRWTSKSVRHLAQELKRMGHQASHQTVAQLLHDLGYSLQGNRKTLEGSSHPDRDAQFEHINSQAQEYFATSDPVISVDTKKKELVGEYKNGGREWHPQGMAPRVKVHDFADPDLGRAVPYGVYDVAGNSAWVSVGIDHDTSSFAVETIRRWWYAMGRERYPGANRLFITADGGGSNGSRVRLWKLELQAFADELGIPIAVSHFPPGTSKWNKIEHRLFSFISQNWRGTPLTSHEVIVSLIASTTTQKGLLVRAQLDTTTYPAGTKVSGQEIANLDLRRDDFHGEWNYTIFPRKKITGGGDVIS
jgi:transposase